MSPTTKKGLAAFLKAIGYLIPLMDAEYANYYTREVMLILIREFQSPDEEMKKIVLKVWYNLYEMYIMISRLMQGHCFCVCKKAVNLILQ